MFKSLFRLLILAILPTISGFAQSASVADVTANETLFLRLDSIIANQQSLIDKKDDRISGLRSTLGKRSTPSDRLGVMRQLYDEYSVYNSDSALHYANKAYELIKEINPDDDALISEWELNIGACHIAQGLFVDGMETLGSINPKKIDCQLKGRYFNTMADAHILHALYLKDNQDIWNKEIAKSIQYLDSIIALQDKTAKYLWVPVAYGLSKGDNEFNAADISELRKSVDSEKTCSRNNAINAYWLARYYNAVGNGELMIRYMVIAAINDAMIVNRDIAAMQMLAFYTFEAGQIDRAYNYLSYAVNQANNYHSRHRMVNMSDLSSSIRDTYRHELEKRDVRLRRLAVVLGIFAVLLLGCVAFILIEYRKLQRTRQRLSTTNNALQNSINEHNKTISNLEEVNSQLKDANCKLIDMNLKLQEANEQKLGVLAYAFKLTSKFVDDIENYRKKLFRKFRSKDISDLEILINDPDLIKEQYKAFYEGFDRMTLSLFPNLPEEYNATVIEDLRVSPETISKTKTLNTRLRIYALKRLGVSKSADIASMLNVSIRTVYNNKNGNISNTED